MTFYHSLYILPNVTVNVQLAVLPAASLAVQLTVLAPGRNMSPDEETHVTVGGISIMLSDAIGSIHETESSDVEMFGGHVDILGGISSKMQNDMVV